MMSPQERYERDPMFKQMVDIMESVIAQAGMTPTEIREAAVLACIHYEMRHPSPVRFPVGDVCTPVYSVSTEEIPFPSSPREDKG